MTWQLCLFVFFSTKQAVALEKTIYLTLTSIYSLFDEDGVPEQWKNVELFQNIIDRQIEENQCVRSYRKKKLAQLCNI